MCCSFSLDESVDSLVQAGILGLVSFLMGFICLSV